MKNSVLILVFIVFYACQEKHEIIPDGNFLERKTISDCYNHALHKDATNEYSACKNTADLEKLASAQPQEYQAMVAILTGMQNSSKSLYQLGIKNYENALFLLRKSNVDSLKGKALNGIGNNYKITGDYKKAVKHLFAALALYEKNGDTLGMGSTHSLLGDLYFQMEEMDKAKASIEKAMEVLKHHKTSKYYLAAAHSLANYYGMAGDFEKALELDRMGIRICDSISLPQLKVSFLDNKANCYMFSNKMDSAYYYFNECLKLDRRIGNKKQIADTHSNIGQFFLMKKDYKKAEEQVQKSIDLLKNVDGKPNLDKSYKILSEIYATQKLYQKAFEVQKEQMANRKLMLEEREASASAEYKIVYETQKKEAKIRFLELENKVRNLKMQQQQLQVKRTTYAMLFLALLLVFIVIVAYFWHKHAKLRSVLERKLVVKQTEEAERIRMAKDIHDDLGSGLSKINFLSEVISLQSNHLPNISHSMDSIKETAQKMIDNMRDLIWAMNPENPTLANLVARMREHTTDYLEDYAIDIVYVIPENLPQKLVSNEVHRALFLVVKEVVHNIAKHAQATQINFTIELTAVDFQLRIQDNGRGFIPSENKGNGMKNMWSRIEQIGGDLSITSSPEMGTAVYFGIKTDKLFNKL